VLSAGLGVTTTRWFVWEGIRKDPGISGEALDVACGGVTSDDAKKQ